MPPPDPAAPAEDPSSIDPSAVYTDLSVQDGIDGRPYVVLNMVSTVDGKTALGLSAAGIGSRTDARLMRQIRAAVDGIIWGAGTLRADIVDPRVDVGSARRRRELRLSPQPVAAAVSGSLDLEPSNRFFVNGPARTVLFTTDAAPADRRRALAPYATIVSQPGPTVDLRAAVQYLHDELGVRRLLSEGGPGLNEHLVAAGLLDELFWTIAPKVSGGHGRTLLDGVAPAMAIRAGMELLSLYEHDGELYTRYRLLRGVDGSYLTTR